MDLSDCVVLRNEMYLTCRGDVQSHVQLALYPFLNELWGMMKYRHDNKELELPWWACNDHCNLMKFENSGKLVLSGIAVVFRDQILFRKFFVENETFFS